MLESLLTSLPTKNVSYVPTPGHPSTTTCSTQHVPYVPWPPRAAPIAVRSALTTSRAVTEYDKSIVSSRTLSQDSQHTRPVATSTPLWNVSLPSRRDTSLTLAATKTEARSDGGVQHGSHDSTSVSYQVEQWSGRPSFALPSRRTARDYPDAPRRTRVTDKASSSEHVSPNPVAHEQLVSMSPSSARPRTSGSVVQHVLAAQRSHGATGVTPAAQVPIHLFSRARSHSASTRFTGNGYPERAREVHHEYAPRIAEDGSSTALRNSYHALQHQLKEHMRHHIQRQMESASLHLRASSVGRIGGLHSVRGDKKPRHKDSRNTSPLGRENVLHGPRQVIDPLLAPTPSCANLTDSATVSSYALTQQPEIPLANHPQQPSSSFLNPQESCRNGPDTNHTNSWFHVHDKSIERCQRGRDSLLERPSLTFRVASPHHPSVTLDGSPNNAASHVFADIESRYFRHSTMKSSNAQLVRPIMASPMPPPRQASPSSCLWDSPPTRVHSGARSVAHESLLTDTAHVLASVVPRTPHNDGDATPPPIPLVPENSRGCVSVTPFPAERRSELWYVDDYFRTVVRPRDLKRDGSRSSLATRAETTQQSSQHYWQEDETDAVSLLETAPALSAEESARTMKGLPLTTVTHAGHESPGRIQNLLSGNTDKLLRQSRHNRPPSPALRSFHTNSLALQSCHGSTAVHLSAKNRSPCSTPAFHIGQNPNPNPNLNPNPSSLSYTNGILPESNRPYAYSQSTTPGPSITTSGSLCSTQQHTELAAHHLLDTNCRQSECFSDSQHGHSMELRATGSTCPALQSLPRRSSETIFITPRDVVVPASCNDSGVASTKYERVTKARQPPRTEDRTSATPRNARDMVGNNTSSIAGNTMNQPSHERAINLSPALLQESAMPVGHGVAPPHRKTPPSEYTHATASRGHLHAARDAPNVLQDGLRASGAAVAAADLSCREDVRLFMQQAKVSLASLLCDDVSDLSSTVAANSGAPHSGPLPHRSVRSTRSRSSSRDGMRADVHGASGSKTCWSRSESPYGGPVAHVTTKTNRGLRDTVLRALRRPKRIKRSVKRGASMASSNTSLISGEELLYAPSSDGSRNDDECSRRNAADNEDAEEVLYQWSRKEESTGEEDDCGMPFVTPISSPRDTMCCDNGRASNSTAEDTCTSTNCAVEKRTSATDRVQELPRRVTPRSNKYSTDV